MSIYDELLRETEIPPLVKVRYRLPLGNIQPEAIPGIVADAVYGRCALAKIQPGDSVAVAVGSREISHLAVIVKSVVNLLLVHGAKPFIFPAMGSHGGATAEGQRGVLAGYGVTEEAMGVPVHASMQTTAIGETPTGLSVHLDTHANSADHIVPIGRIKPHTDFRGKVESGLHKMLAIGCGKQYGANICHTLGFPNMSRNVEAIAQVILRMRSVPFGLGIIEDAFHNTYKIAAVPGEQFGAEEPELLLEAKTLIARIPFEKVDTIVVEEAGKDISGAGIDPNVTGRSIMLGLDRPYVETIALLNLTDKSHHNASGVGSADVITRRYYDKIHFEETYPNGITSHDLQSIKIPAVMPNDRIAVKMALHGCVKSDPAVGYRLVWLKNTLHMNEFLISEPLLSEATNHPDITVVGSPAVMEFDADGNVPWL